MPYSNRLVRIYHQTRPGFPIEIQYAVQSAALINFERNLINFCRTIRTTLYQIKSPKKLLVYLPDEITQNMLLKYLNLPESHPKTIDIEEEQTVEKKTIPTNGDSIETLEEEETLATTSRTVKILELSKMNRSDYGVLSSKNSTVLILMTPNEEPILTDLLLAGLIRFDYLFDTLQSVYWELSPTGRVHQKKNWISKQEALHRLTYLIAANGDLLNVNQPLVVHRMLSFDDFKRLPENYMVPLEWPLENMILELLPYYTNEEVSYIVGEPIETISTLLDYYRELSPSTWNFIKMFPLSPRIASVFWRIHSYFEKSSSRESNGTKDVLPYLAVLVMIDCFGPSYLVYPLKRTDQFDMEYTIYKDQHTDKYFKRFQGRSDVHTLANIMYDLLSGISDEVLHSHDIGPEDIKDTINIGDWCERNSMRVSKIAEVIDILSQCIKICQANNIECKDTEFETDEIVNDLRPALTSAFGGQKYRLQRDVLFQTTHLEDDSTGDDSVRYWPEGKYLQSVGNDYILDSYQSVNTFIVDPPVFLLAIISRKVPTLGIPVCAITIGLDIPRL
jgi:hypothetical protein